MSTCNYIPLCFLETFKFIRKYAQLAQVHNRMNSKDRKKIYQKIKSRGVKIDHACEVGVYLPATSNIIDFIKDGVRGSLVEADPNTVKILEEYFRNYSVTIHPVAVWSEAGTVRLSRAAASTFVSAIQSSPAVINDKYVTSFSNSFDVKAVVFSEIDTCDIDLLSVDIEGGEWHVINNLKSRPKVISVETHGKYYTNPFIEEINRWMHENGYVRWYKDSSDTVFIKKGSFEPSFFDNLDTFLSMTGVAFKKFKKKFKL
jgi:FkbM family methyltransferase